MTTQQQHDEFVALLDGHHRQLFGYILAITRNFADAEDVYQQATFLLWQKYGEFEPGSNFGRWASAFCRYTALLFMRDKRREHLLFTDEVYEVLESDHSQSGDSYTPGQLQALETCIGRLEPGDRQLIEKCYGAGALVGQVAEQMERSKHSIYNSLRRIRTVLLECVQRKLAREERS